MVCSTSTFSSLADQAIRVRSGEITTRSPAAGTVQRSPVLRHWITVLFAVVSTRNSEPARLSSRRSLTRLAQIRAHRCSHPRCRPGLGARPIDKANLCRVLRPEGLCAAPPAVSLTASGMGVSVAVGVGDAVVALVSGCCCSLGRWWRCCFGR